MSKLSKVNRKLKSAMKVFIKNEDEGSLRGIERLIQERRVILTTTLVDEKDGK